MPVMDSIWKQSFRASWNRGCICFRIMAGTPSGPAALWFGVRRRASCRIVGEIRPDIMGVLCTWGDVTRVSHGIGAPGGSVGSGDNAWISIFFTCAMTSTGSMICLPVISSRIPERFVERGWESSSPAAVRRMD